MIFRSFHLKLPTIDNNTKIGFLAFFPQILIFFNIFSLYQHIKHTFFIFGHFFNRIVQINKLCQFNTPNIFQIFNHFQRTLLRIRVRFRIIKNELKIIRRNDQTSGIRNGSNISHSLLITSKSRLPEVISSKNNFLKFIIKSFTKNFNDSIFNDVKFVPVLTFLNDKIAFFPIFFFKTANNFSNSSKWNPFYNIQSR